MRSQIAEGLLQIRRAMKQSDFSKERTKMTTVTIIENFDYKKKIKAKE